MYRWESATGFDSRCIPPAGGSMSSIMKRKRRLNGNNRWKSTATCTITFLSRRKEGPRWKDPDGRRRYLMPYAFSVSGHHHRHVRFGYRSFWGSLNLLAGRLSVLTRHQSFLHLTQPNMQKHSLAFSPNGHKKKAMPIPILPVDHPSSLPTLSFSAAARELHVTSDLVDLVQIMRSIP